MPEIRGVQSVMTALRAAGRRVGKRGGHAVAVVGFSTAYALHVHENTDMYHRVGQAKYLEQPARTMREELQALIFQEVEGGATMGQALSVAGLRLQREAQLLVPVDTGALRASAFTVLEEDR